MKNTEPEIIADVTFYPTEAGGKKLTVHGEWYGCPCKVGEEYWECRILLLHKITIAPGETRRVGIVFLSSEGAEKVRLAGKFLLWEGRSIGEGIVVDPNP